MNNIKFDFDDILLVPAEETTINSRSEVDPYYYNEFVHLPLWAAPMDCVIGEKNAIEFAMNKINVCFPRGVNYPINNFGYFHSLSLDEFYRVFVEGKFVPDSIFKNNSNDRKSYVLIDIANGHMKKLVDAIKAAKEKYGDRLVIMCGNVAHPETYRRLSDAGADLVRCFLGNGSGCLTTQQISVGYPSASLIKECYEIKQQLINPAAIVADGGMKKYSDIIKALALGSTYVMVGNLFNKSIQSSGTNYFLGVKISQKIASFLFKKGFTIKKKWRGMSTKEVQREWGKKESELKTSEGIVTKQNVEYTLSGWTENFTDYLKSAMSYCGARTLDEFIGKANYVQITEAAQNRFKK